MKPQSEKTRLTTRAALREVEKTREPVRHIKSPNILLTALETVAVWLAMPLYKSFLIEAKTDRVQYESVVFPQNIVALEVAAMRERGGVRPFEAMRMMPIDPFERRALIRRAALEMKVGVVDDKGDIVFNPYEYIIKMEEKRSRRRGGRDEAR